MHPWIFAGLCSLLFPGLGQIYNRQFARGINFILLQFIFLLIAYYSLGFLGFFALANYGYSLIDSINSAPKQEDQAFGYRLIPVGIAFVVLLGILYPSLVATGMFGVPSWKAQPLEERAAIYLEEKYGQLFRVSQVEYDWRQNIYQFSANPLSKPEVHFGVYLSKKTNDFRDGYLSQLWNYQAKKEVLDQLVNLYENEPFVEARVIFHNENESSQDYSKIRAKYPDEVKLIVNVIVFAYVTELNKRDHAEKIGHLISYLQKVGNKKISIKVDYFDPDLKISAKKTLMSIPHDEFVQTYKDEHEYRVEISLNDTSVTQTPQMIETYFKSMNKK